MLFSMTRINQKHVFYVLFALLSFFASTVFAENTSSNAPVPIEYFYKGEILSDVALSPDGTHIAALKNIGSETAIMVLEIATGKVFYPSKTDNKKFKFNWVEWGNDERLLVSLRTTRDYGKQNYSISRLVSMDAKKKSEMVGLTPKKYVGEMRRPSLYQDKIIDLLPDDPKHILMGYDNEREGCDAVHKVNIYTGAMVTRKKSDASINNWIADRQGVIRVGVGYDDDTQKLRIKVLIPGTKDWVFAWEYKPLEQPAIDPLGFGKDPKDLYLLADYQGRQAVYKVDLSKKDFPMELVVSDDKRDIRGRLIYSQRLKDVVGIYFNDGSYKSIYWNNEFKAFQAGLDKAMPDTSNFIIDLSDDDRKYIVYITNSVTPGTLLYGNRDTKELNLLADLHPGLTEDVLSKKVKMTYKSRDGLDLEGFLSLPKSGATQNLATIILPHGGPFSEDGVGYDDFSAFLVTRGYAVFQPNFRGSTGYGFDFMKLAVGNMGLSMQDDIEDGAKYLIEKKIANPEKMCIVGASYGGYAALMGITKTPDLYKCAISFAGISDWKKIWDGANFWSNKKLYRKQIGNDFDVLEKTSPANMVEKIKAPVLLIHGNLDTQVPMEQSDYMAKKLKAAGKKFEYIKLDEGTHFLDYLPHRQTTFEAMDAFLKKHLPL